MNEIINTFVGTVQTMQQHLPLVFALMGLLWLIHLVNYLLHYRLNMLGIFPRHLTGIPGIFLSPFLHGHFTHIFFNSIPLFVLANLVMISGLPTFLLVSFIIILLSGSAIWLFGRRAIHVGASSVIMGYMGYLLINSFHQGTMVAIGVGVVVIYYFGSMLLDLFPSDVKVSWEGHVFGFLAGIVASYSVPLLLPCLVSHQG